MSIFMPPEVRAAVAEKFVITGRGAGGIGEMASELPEDDASVLWGLVTCVIGSGTFARTKYVMVSVAGSNCPAIRRMKSAEMKPEAGMMLGLDCIAFNADKREEVTLDAIVEKLLKECVSDNLGAAVMTASSIKADLEEQARKAMMALRDRRESSVCEYTGPRTIVAMGKKISVPKVLEYVQKKDGPLNWALIDSGQKLVEAGGGGVQEMREFLDDKEVSFGIIRMGFGSGTFKRNFWLFIHWAGDKAHPTVRGKANAELATCKKLLQPSQVDFFGAHQEDITIEILIEKVLKYCRVDGDTKKSQQTLDLAAYNEALLEDMKKLEEEFGLDKMATPVDEDDLSTLNVQDAVRQVRDTNNPYNWLTICAKNNVKPGTGLMGAVGAAGKLRKTSTKESNGVDTKAGFTGLKKSAMPDLVEGIKAGGENRRGSLKHVETNDKSSPVIDKTAKIGKNGHSDLMAQIAKLP
tara:strand:+ start:1413 stop:2810 length:1398 start_codon:yes stop_codon:yes gene_type:complete